MKIIFLDLDGPMIPGRSFLAAGKTEIIPFEVSDFDPVAVALINRACEEHGWKIVLHSSWVRLVGGKRTFTHCVKQGLHLDNFHDNAWCDENENWRYTRVARWLEGHPEVTDYVIIDDTPYQQDIMSGYPHPEDMEKHVMLVSFDDGLLSEHYKRLREYA